MGLDCPHCSKTIDGWVPEDRLKKATADKREAQATAVEAARQLEELTGQAAGAADLQAALDKATTELAQVTTAHASQVEVMRHGVSDPDEVADLLAIYQRRAPESISLGDWLSDTAALPRSVSALLGSTQPAAEASTAPAAPAAAPVEAAPAVSNGTPQALPATNAGAVPTPPANALPGAADIGNMSTEQYRAHRDRLLADLTSPGKTV